MIERGEIERVIAEQPGDAEQPDRRPLAKDAPERSRVAPHQPRPAQQRDREGDAEGEAEQLERRHLAGRGREQGERRPQQDGDEADQRRAQSFRTAFRMVADMGGVGRTPPPGCQANRATC